jgi:hypothetical protein
LGTANVLTLDHPQNTTMAVMVSPTSGRQRNGSPPNAATMTPYGMSLSVMSRLQSKLVALSQMALGPPDDEFEPPTVGCLTSLRDLIDSAVGPEIQRADLYSNHEGGAILRLECGGQTREFEVEADGTIDYRLYQGGAIVQRHRYR